MGRLSDLTQEIKNRIESVDGVVAGSVLVFQPDKLETLFRQAVQKGKGNAVVVRLVSGKSFSRRPKVFRPVGTYSVTIFTKPILNKSDQESGDIEQHDNLMESIAKSIHGWWPESIGSNGGQWCEVTAIDFPSDGAFAISRLTIEAPGTSQ